MGTSRGARRERRDLTTRATFYCGVVQLVERVTVNHKVEGSIPSSTVFEQRVSFEGIGSENRGPVVATHVSRVCSQYRRFKFQVVWEVKQKGRVSV